ncbi:MAG TPA: PhnD/SsuA/transferrin family substrate-binding protein [Microvirga sp.]|jgi:4,5-dihydroxyphthalate decarboxylase|nr:PhnD/SsuA/transferrin family substrate-binding protein [Microvirga sp.]
MTQTLTVGCGAYDRTWPLIARTLRVEGADLAWTVLPPEEVFLRGMLGGEFDVAEMSFSSYLLQVSRGEARYTAIPVFVSKKFRHGAVYVRADAGIRAPEDLKGRRIGLPEYQLTANVWVRGILSDEYGVAAEDVEWVIGGIDAPGREEKIPVSLPARIRNRKIGPGETLWEMLTRGEIDAIVAPRAPKAFLAGDPRVRRLFDDVKGVEQAYYRKTGIFPPMHILGIRTDVLERDGTLPRRLFDAFERARLHAVQELHQVAYDYAMLPWLGEHLRETEAVMGADYWQNGFANNRRVIETMARYSHEQGLTGRRLAPEELFLPIDPGGGAA